MKNSRNYSKRPSRRSRKTTPFQLIILRDKDLKSYLSGLKRVGPSMTILRSDTTLPITVACMPRETSKRERQFYMFPKNKLLPWKWHLPPQWARKCSRRVSVRDLSLPSTHSCAPLLCKSVASQTPNGTFISTFYLRATLISRSFSQTRKRNGSKEVPSWIKLRRK
jgi:hypothetical protein